VASTTARSFSLSSVSAVASVAGAIEHTSTAAAWIGRRGPLIDVEGRLTRGSTPSASDPRLILALRAEPATRERVEARSGLSWAEDATSRRRDGAGPRSARRSLVSAVFCPPELNGVLCALSISTVCFFCAPASIAATLSFAVCLRHPRICLASTPCTSRSSALHSVVTL